MHLVDCILGFRQYQLLYHPANVRKTKAPRTTNTFAINGKRCPKCGVMKKLGKLSCCARGGAWFQKCGNGDDSNFNHTWIEGVRACNMSRSPLLTEGPAQVMLVHNKFTSPSVRTAWLSSPMEDYDNNYPNAGTVDSEGVSKLANIVEFASILLTAVYLQI